jgi:predicted naringenin-chalcone synthase
MSYLIDISTASPPFRVAQSTAAEELKKRMGGTRGGVSRMIDATLLRSGIASRAVVIPDGDPANESHFYPDTADLPGPDTRTRMQYYKKWSGSLAVQAASEVLRTTDTDPALITRLITVSCTGFSAPSFDYDIVTSLGLSRRVQRTHVGFMGCAAALVGMTAVSDALHIAEGDPARALLVAVELCSLHLHTEPTRDNIVANMIFADGCAAALFGADHPEHTLARIVSTHTYHFSNAEHCMTWEIGNQGFEMTLSSDLPDVLTSQAIPAVMDILDGMGLEPADISLWALHPGGRAILDALQTGLGLSDDQVAPSRAVLQHYGNMSSASILYVVKELFVRHRLAPHQWLCAIAFGPGLTMEMVLLRGVS